MRLAHPVQPVDDQGENLTVNAKWPQLLLLLAACGAGYWWMQSEGPGDGPAETSDLEEPGTEDPESPDLIGDAETPIERARREERERVEKAKRDIARRRKALTSGTVKQRLAVLREVAALRQGGVAYLDEVIGCIWHEDSEVRELTTPVLLVIGDRAIKPLLDALSDRLAAWTGSPARLRGYDDARTTFLNFGERAYPQVVQAMSRPHMSMFAATLFQHARAHNLNSLVSSLPALRDNLALESVEVRYWSVFAIGVIRSHGAPAVRDLTNLLDSPEQRLRVAAAMALGEIGPEARDAVQTLERHLEKTSVQGNERRATIQALAKIRKE